MQEERKESYVTKLVVMLIKKAGGCIRIAAADLMQDDIGCGVQVHFDYISKELVLTSVPAGAKTYFVKENQPWLANPSLPSPPSLEPKRPLSQDDLIAKAWTESAGTPSNQEVKEQPLKRNKVVQLTDETMAVAELERRKQKALREIEQYGSPQPPSRPVGQRQVFIKP